MMEIFFMAVIVLQAAGYESLFCCCLIHVWHVWVVLQVSGYDVLYLGGS